MLSSGVEDLADETSIWRSRGFQAYLGSTAFSGMALAMQQLLFSWILIGILELPADQVGLIQGLIGIPGIFLMLMGGARADSRDARRLLLQIYFLAPILPIFLVVIEQWQWLGVASVTLWGFGMGVVQSYSMPAQQAILNRVSGSAVQEGVTAATAIGFIVQVVGLALAGQIDRVGVTPVLVMQASTLLLAALMTLRIAPMKVTPSSHNNKSSLADIRDGLQATYRNPVVFDSLIITFISSIFNAGSFVTAFPFIVKRVYDGDALMLAILMAIFFAGAALSNMLLLRFMPLKFPGKVFLVMQLSRVFVVFLMWIEPDFWLLVVATVGWGLNMGVTTNLARGIVQESAESEFTGRVMAVFSIGMVGSAPIGAILLGWVIERFGTLDALVPAMFVSVALFIYGVYFTKVWTYRSKAAL